MGVDALTTTQLRCLPSTSLTALSNSLASQKSKLMSKAGELTARFQKLIGRGAASLQSGGKAVVDGFASLEKVQAGINNLVQPVKSVSNLIQGALDDPNVLSPFKDSGFATNADAQSLVSNLSEFTSTIESPLESGSVRDQLDLLQTSLADTLNEIQGLNAVQDNIKTVLENRANGLDAEPELDTSWIVSDPLLEDMAARYEEFVKNNIILPFEENQAFLEQFSLDSQAVTGGEAPLFDLEYGPPVSTKGQFVLSEDGLYYDSRKGGIPEVSGFAAASSTWNLDYAPNIGGKGQHYGAEDFEELTNTIFSTDYQVTNKTIKALFDVDDVIATFEGDKSRHIGLVSGQIEELRDNDETALANSYFGSIAAIAAAYDKKIRKRKKQLELVGAFGAHQFQLTDAFGNATFGSDVFSTGLGENIVVQKTGTLDNVTYEVIDRIPINDFSFLKGSGQNVSLDTQRDLIIVSEDLQDSILPIRPTFHITQAQPFSVLNHFEIESIAPNDFLSVQSASGGTGPSGTGSFIKTLNDSITREGLIVNYNFIKPHVCDASADTTFAANLDNLAPDYYGFLEGQLVGSSIDYVFPSGVSIPRLQGAAYNPSGLDKPASGGSYVRIPNNNNALNALTLNTQLNKETNLDGGFSFDFWVHVPDLSSMTDVHRYKIVLANENSGGDVISSPAGTLGGSQTFTNAKRTISTGTQTKTTDFSKVHGMIMGWRDRGGSTAPSGVEFFVAPTVSNNENTGRFGHSVCIAESSDSDTPDPTNVTELGLYIPSSTVTTTNTRNVLDCSGQFCHYSVVFNYVSNSVTVYLDGESLASTALNTSFDVPTGESLNIPSLTKQLPPTTSTQIYEASYNPGLRYGPRVGLDSELGTKFTPWIIGGGFTDSISQCMVNQQGVAIPGNDPGFLGYNTNDTYHISTYTGNGLIGQHAYSNTAIPSDALSIGGNIARAQSGLDGFVGSFKIYRKALTTKEVTDNYDAQQAYFKNISV